MSRTVQRAAYYQANKDAINARKRAYYKKNKTAINARLTAYRRRNRKVINERARVLHRVRMYGLSKDDYIALLRKQKGCCAICRTPCTNPHVDHCHRTGRVRGLLCSKCNTGLGQLGDTQQSITRALRYLQKNT